MHVPAHAGTRPPDVARTPVKASQRFVALRGGSEALSCAPHATMP